MRSKPSQLRDLLLIALPVLLVVGGAVWLARHLVDPPHPARS